MTVLARARVILEGDAVQLTRTLQGASAAMTQAGANMTRIGRQLTLRVTAPLLAIGGAAAKMGADFEAEMQKIVGLVGVSQDQVDAWGQDILDMAPRLGAAPRELAEGLFFVTSAGLRGAEAMDVLEASAKASAAGLGDIATIADLATSAMNAYGADTLDASQATDVLTAAVREGKVQPEELAGAMGQVLPVASNMGIRFDEVGAAMAAMSRTGTNASVAATQLRQIMISLLKPSQQAEEALAGMGLSAADLRKQIREEGLLSVLQTLSARFEGNEEAAAQVFGNIRALAGVMDLMGESADATAGIFASLEDASGSLDHAFDTAAETARFRMSQALAEMQVLALRLADIVLPIVADAVEKVGRGVGWLGNLFADLPRPMQVTIVGLFGVAAAAGPVLLIVGQLTIALAALGKAFVALKITTAISAFVGWGKAVASLAVGVRSLSAALALLKIAIGPAGWVIAGLGVAASVAGVWLSRTREANRVAREAAERVDAYATALAGWTQEARRAEQARLEEALSRQRDELEALRDEAAEARAAVRGSPPSERLAARGAIAEADRAVENQRKLVKRLEDDYKAVSASIREAATETGGLEREIQGMLDGLNLGAAVPDEVSSAMEALERDLHAAARQSELLGDEFDESAARASAYRTAIESLAASSVDMDTAIGSNGETLRDLAGAYLVLEEEAMKAAEAERTAREEREEIDRATTGLTDRLRENAELQALLGDEFDRTSADARAYEVAVRNLVAAGVDLDAVVGPQGETLRELANTYLDLAAGVEVANSAMAEGERVTRRFMAPLEEKQFALERYRELLDEGAISQETFNRAVEEAARRYEEATDPLRRLRDEMILVAEMGVDAFAAFATGATNAIDNFVRQAMRMLARLIARMLVARALLAAFPGVGFAVSLAGQLDPTALARGGRFRRGEPILVGEEGPELIFPDVGGRVFSAPDTSRMMADAAARTVGGVATVAGAAAGGGGTLSLDLSSLPPAPRTVTPDAVATDDWWRRAFGHLKLDYDDRGGR